MEVFLTLLYTIIFALIITKLPFFRVEGLSRIQLVVLFLVKIFAGSLLYFIYSNYADYNKEADIFKYFADSEVMYNALWVNPPDFFKMLFGINNQGDYFDENYYTVMNNWYRVYQDNMYNDTRTVIRFNALVRIFSFGYYHVHTVFICFFSFIGLTGIYKFFTRKIHDKKPLIIIAVFLTPSLLFWGSGVLKEGILVFAMGVMLYYLDTIIKRKFKILYWILLLFAIFILLHVKIYFIAVLAPLLIAYYWVETTSKRFILLKYLVVLVAIFFIGLNIHYIFPGINIMDMIARKQHEFIAFSNATDPGSMIYVKPVKSNIWSFISLIPLAFFNTFLRPHFLDINNLLVFFAFLENLLLFAFVVFALVFKKKQVNEKNLIYFCILFVFASYILIGLISPVLGATVRYKAPLLPFFIVVFIIIFDEKKFLNNFPKLKRKKI